MASSRTKKAFHDELAILEALLRLVTHDHPFQPALAASIDPRAWSAIFVVHCKALQDRSLEIAANEELQQACRELHNFAATLYGAAHFARFESYRHPELDAVDFEPDEEFFENNERWLQATAAVQSSRHELTERLRAINSHREKVCNQLRKVIFESHVGPKASFPAALIEASGSSIRPSTLRTWLTPLSKRSNAEQERRKRRIRLDLFIDHLDREQLIQAVAQVHPHSGGMSAALRSARQSLAKKLQNALGDVRASSHLQRGWEILSDFLTDAHALSAMVSGIRQLAASKPIRSDTALQSGSVILDSVRRLMPEVLDPQLRKSWWSHLEAPEQLQAAISSLRLIDGGHSAVGKNTLGERLKGDMATTGDTGWIDKADERLHALGVPLIAIHGSENWVHQPRPTSSLKPIRSPRTGQGWLINPLIVLHPHVARQLR